MLYLYHRPDIYIYICAQARGPQALGHMRIDQTACGISVMYHIALQAVQVTNHQPMQVGALNFLYRQFRET